MEQDALKELVTSLLNLLGLEPDTIVVTNGYRTLVAITAKDPQQFIGPHGEHLRALNTLARRLAEGKHGEEAASFLIDVNRYYEEKMDTVRANARILAQRVRLFKHEVEMSPMSPYERLVVHELFADDADIKTESAGEGKFRHVVLKFKS